jgi:hypothetical protein
VRAPDVPAAYLPPLEWNEQPWARWNVAYTERGGAPILTETNLWFLMAHHPETVEDAGDGTYWLHLDRPYRARLAPGRAFYVCLPAPGHGRPA